MEDKNFIERSVEFLREVVSEGKKVTWPNWKQAALATVAVVIFILISAGYLALVDWVISLVLRIFI